MDGSFLFVCTNLCQVSSLHSYLKFSGGTFSIRSSTLQFSARARRSSVSACALLMSFCRCSYCWMVRTGTSACPASSDWLNPANVRMAFRFVSGFAARYNSRSSCLQTAVHPSRGRGVYSSRTAVMGTACSISAKRKLVSHW